MSQVRADGSNGRRFRLIFAVLGKEYGAYRRQMFQATCLTGIASVIEVGIVFLIAGIGTAMLKPATSFKLTSHVNLDTRTAALITIAAVVVRGIDDLIASWYKFGYQERYESEARTTLLKNFLDAEWFVQSEDDSGNVQTITVSYLRLAASSLSQVQDTLTAGVAFLVFLVASCIEGGWNIVIILAASLILAVALRPLIEWSHRAGKDFRTAMLAFTRLAIELFDMAREIRLFKASSYVDAKIGETSASVAKADRDNNLANGVLSSLQASAVYFLGALGLYAIVALHVPDPAKWVTIVLFVYRGLGNGRIFQSTYGSLVNSLPSIVEMQDARDKWRSAAVPTSGVEFEPPLTAIEFDDVSFTYPEGTVALSHASFQVAHGAAVGLMGPSGSGKSTVVQLLLRLRLATEGEVRVNGTNIAELRPRSWYGHAVIVPQEAQLFSATVLENVTSFRDSISRDDAMDALRRAHVLDEILALPDGIDTMLGETGRALSGGQRQRVCIARALAAKPDVLVLDEPTSALDLISEDGIRLTLEELRGEMTIVIIAHRMSTLRVCDTVMILENGSITAFGPREELEANSTFFAEAVRLAKMVADDPQTATAAAEAALVESTPPGSLGTVDDAPANGTAPADRLVDQPPPDGVH